MKTCASCGTRVIPRSDGTCPSCRNSSDVATTEQAIAPGEPAAKTPAKSAFPTVPIFGSLLGVVIASVTLNLSRSGAIDGMTILTVLAALVGGIAGVFGVRALLAALRRR